MSPRAKKFLSARLAGRDPLHALQRLDGHRRERDLVDVEVGERAVFQRVRLVARLLEVPLVKASVFRISVAPFGMSAKLVFSAAGFMATRTSGRSPGVRMSWSAKWT